MMKSRANDSGVHAVLGELEPLGTGHRDRYHEAVRAGQQMGWGYYFPHLMAQNKRGKSGMYIVEDSGSVCVFRWTRAAGIPRLDLYLPPIPFQPEVLHRCLERANEFNSNWSAKIMRVDARDAVWMQGDGSLRVRPRREQYLFAPGSYEELSGKDYYTIRRNVASVERLGGVEVAAFRPEHAEGCHRLLDRWRQEHQHAHGTAGGVGVSKRAIELAGQPGQTDLLGEVVFVEGKLVAFAFGGEIRPGLACSFDRKCDTDIRGLSYYHFRSFLRRLGDFEIVNDGSDAGRGGLRQLKESFRPVKMHTEYRVTQRTQRKVMVTGTVPSDPSVQMENRITILPGIELNEEQCVGLMIHFKKRGNPAEYLTPSLYNRAVLLGEELARDGIDLFLYSPDGVTEENAPVEGYVVDGLSFRPAKRGIPRVNANWTYGTRKLIDRGMGYKNFRRWVRERGIDVFVPYEFSELVSNKCDAYRVIEAYQKDLYPRTEDFLGTEDQIRDFLSLAGLAFVKPRAGNKGNKIFVIRRAGADYSLRYYHKGVCRVLEPIALSAVPAIVEIGATDQKFCIQAGVESLLVNGSVFDVRVVMVNDGSNWYPISETRLAPQGSDVSNIYQGGSIQETEPLLGVELGEERAQRIIREIMDVSLGVARHLDSFFPGSIMELGLDLIVDRSLCIRLVEVNAKPGVSGMASEKRLPEWKPEELPYFEKTVRQQMSHVANFLRSKLHKEPES